jgi:hypothetical protein
MKPISFNKEMTQALLEGRKTQTRRPIKFEPHPDPFHSPYHTIEEGKVVAAKSPYGRIGDLVWVREFPEMEEQDSRIILKITSTKIQKLQDITEEDAKAEGCFSFIGREPKYYHHTYINDFKMLWNSIYNNWDENPWVWVYGFEVVSIKES